MNKIKGRSLSKQTKHKRNVNIGNNSPSPTLKLFLTTFESVQSRLILEDVCASFRLKVSYVSYHFDGTTIANDCKEYYTA